MTLLYHHEFATVSLLFFSSNHVTFYSNLTDVEVMMPFPRSPQTLVSERHQHYLRALIEMISILLSHLMMDEPAAAGTFDKLLSAATTETD